MIYLHERDCIVNTAEHHIPNVSVPLPTVFERRYTGEYTVGKRKRKRKRKSGRDDMKKKFGDGLSKTTVSCMQEAVLRQLVRIAGLEEMTIWRNRKKEWHLSVTVTQRSHVVYLSTRRAPRVPRAFTRLEAALAAGQRIQATRQVTLVLR